VWVANYNGNSVTELSATTGGAIQVLGSSDGIEQPLFLSSDGTDVWIANTNANTVTELNASTGALVQVLSDPSYGFDNPIGISSDGTDVWVTNDNNDTVTEINASTGALVQVLSGSSFGFNGPWAIDSDGTHVWVSNLTNSTITELNAATGALVQVLSSSSFGFGQPFAISSDGTDLWVANQSSNSVTEVNASTGALVQVLNGSSFGFNIPNAISSDGSHVWVSNRDSNTVTEIASQTGGLVQVLSDASYGFDLQGGIVSDGARVWSTNPSAESVSEMPALYPVTPSLEISNLPSSGSYLGGFTATVALDNGAATSVVSNSPSVCTVSGSYDVSFDSVGTCSLSAAVGAFGNYSAAVGAPQSFVVTKAAPSTPTISNLPGPAAYLGGFTASVSTTGDGLKSVASNTPSVCTVSSNVVVSYVSAGTCSLTPQVTAGALYVAASGPAQTFSVSPANPTQPLITNLPTAAITGGAFTAEIITNSTGAPSVVSNTPSVCTVTLELTVTYLSAGECSLSAYTGFNSDFNSAIGPQQEFSIATAGPPSHPTKFSATLKGTTATFSWLAPTNVGQSAITAYIVTGTPGNLVCRTSGTVLTCSISGLAKKTTYSFSVLAKNTAGRGAPSGARTLQTK
jgi:outer membrane lipoprotein-sorting protein